MFLVPPQIETFLNTFSDQPEPFVIGVSGGADSLYLTYILQTWCIRHHRSLVAVTVNHDLRPEATQEALWVHKQLSKRDIPHTILKWTGQKPSTHIEEKAREKRYQLLLDFCHAQKASVLFLAHHAHDQVETFWIRLARGSGVDGLSAMAPTIKREGILIARPLLHISKESILKALRKNHLKWIEDPMNQDSTYERVQWRQRQATFDHFGLTTDVISKTTKRLYRARQALDFYAQKFVEEHVHISPLGFVQIPEKIFYDTCEEIRVRVLMILLQLFNPQNKAISLESVEKIAIKIPKYATLASCQWVISQHQIFITKETKYLKPKDVPAYQWTHWGNCLIYTNKSFIAEPQAPTPRSPKLPFLIQRSFLKIPKGFTLFPMQHDSQNQKALEKKLKLDYKNKNFIILIQFFNKRIVYEKV